MKKIKKFFSLLLVMLLSLSGVPAMAETTTLANMTVSYIDVGQGDSELITVDGKRILIDAGANDDKCYNYLKAQGITTLDYVIVTHPHEDHVGDMAKIINSFNVGTFYSPQVTTTTKTYENMINALKAKSLKITVPKVNDTLTIGNATLTFLAPNSATYDDLNNYSIVCRLKYGNNSFLFMGDAQNISEGEILQKQLDIQADVLKVGHHGSYSATTQAFLDKINPKYAIISCGKNNDYGHPHQVTLDKLNAKGIKVYRTDLNGTIVATSNGTDITFATTTVGTTSSGNNTIVNTTSTVGDTTKGVDITLNSTPTVAITDNGITLNNNSTVGASYNGNAITYNKTSTVSVTTDNATLDEIAAKLKEEATKIKKQTEEKVSKLKEWLK